MLLVKQINHEIAPLLFSPKSCYTFSMMNEISLKELQARIEREKEKTEITWHFHVLPPHCYINPTAETQFIYENSSQKDYYRFENTEEGMNHGMPIEHIDYLRGMDSGTTHMQNILLRAIKLNDLHYPWHIHVFFPHCFFNQHPEKWTLILEDPKNHVVLKTIQAEEPTQEYLNLVGLYNQQMEYFETKYQQGQTSKTE